MCLAALGPPGSVTRTALDKQRRHLSFASIGTEEAAEQQLYCRAREVLQAQCRSTLSS